MATRLELRDGLVGHHTEELVFVALVGGFLCCPSLTHIIYYVSGRRVFTGHLILLVIAVEKFNIESFQADSRGWTIIQPKCSPLRVVNIGHRQE